MDLSEQLPIKEICIDLNEHCYVARCIPELGEFQVIPSHLRREAKDMILSLSVSLHTNKLDERSVKFPRDWKEAVKERWFPAWLLRRYPVRYTTKVFTVEDRYPDADIYGEFAKRMGAPVRVTRLENRS